MKNQKPILDGFMAAALVASLGLGLRAVWVRNKENKEKIKTKTPQSQTPHFGEYAWGVVDQASWESFPASDPPAW